MEPWGRPPTPRVADPGGLGGSFKTRKLALARTAWNVGELAALRMPDLSALDDKPSRRSL